MCIDKKIYQLRKSNGLSQEKLAEKLNVSKQAVSKWETGVMPDIENVVKIANYFDCSLDYLLKNENENQPIVNDSQKNNQIINKNNHNIINNLMFIIPIVIIVILWILSSFIDYPITHQDYKSGNFYTGFSGFIDYYHLEGYIYISIVIWFLGIFRALIQKVYIPYKKMLN